MKPTAIASTARAVSVSLGSTWPVAASRGESMATTSTANAIQPTIRTSQPRTGGSRRIASKASGTPTQGVATQPSTTPRPISRDSSTASPPKKKGQVRRANGVSPITRQPPSLLRRRDGGTRRSDAADKRPGMVGSAQTAPETPPGKGRWARWRRRHKAKQGRSRRSAAPPTATGCSAGSASFKNRASSPPADQNQRLQHAHSRCKHAKSPLKTKPVKKNRQSHGVIGQHAGPPPAGGETADTARGRIRAATRRPPRSGRR